MHILLGLGFHILMPTSYSWETSHANLHFYLLWKNWKICSIRLKILHVHHCKDHSLGATGGLQPDTAPSGRLCTRKHCTQPASR